MYKIDKIIYKIKRIASYIFTIIFDFSYDLLQRMYIFTYMSTKIETSNYFLFLQHPEFSSYIFQSTSIILL